MTDKTISNCRKVGGDYFRLEYSKIKGNNLNYYLDKFNFEDYWCFKCTNRQRQVDYSEFIEFKYSGYIFFKRDLYDLKIILEWIDWSKDLRGFQFFVKPTPPFNPNKIIIRK